MKKISSLLFVLLLMLASFTAGVEYQRGDVSLDGHVDIADVTCLINYLLNGTWGDEPVTDHEWVDLGLPSGTLWATCNVGANSPEDYGDYFAWGETETKEVYSWETYKWCNGSALTLTKYCTNPTYGSGFFDDKTELDPEDDAAYVNWGSSWRMPTLEQLQELVENCTWTWTQQNGVNGSMVTGPNGNTIFLPAASHYWNESLNAEGSQGRYWSYTLAGNSYGAIRLYFDSAKASISNNDYRFYGLPIRAVRVLQN